MRNNGYDHHYTNVVPPKDGMQFHRGQLTSLQRNRSKLTLNCDHCGIPFQKYAAWAKRSNKHYCGRGCASAGRMVRIPKPCIVCNTEMLLTPYNIKRISTCSKDCSRKRRVKNNINLRSSPDYVAIVNRLRKNALCNTCGTTNGPWVVRGINTWLEDGLSCAEGNDAYLVCQQCHLQSVANLAKQSLYMLSRPKYYEEKNA